MMKSRKQVSEDQKETEASKQKEKESEDLKKTSEQAGEEQTALVDEELLKMQSEIELRDAQIAALKSELEETKDQLLRKVAEFENMRKRVAKERSQLYENARIDALKEFLPINDDLQRTLKASESAEIGETFLEGVKMVANKFSDVLEKYGVSAIDEVNVPFDVELHDALMKQKAPEDNTESNTVLQVLEPGYKMNDKVIRHAKVIVSE